MSKCINIFWPKFIELKYILHIFSLQKWDIFTKIYLQYILTYSWHIFQWRRNIFSWPKVVYVAYIFHFHGVFQVLKNAHELMNWPDKYIESLQFITVFLWKNSVPKKNWLKMITLVASNLGVHYVSKYLCTWWQIKLVDITWENKYFFHPKNMMLVLLQNFVEMLR